MNYVEFLKKYGVLNAQGDLESDELFYYACQGCRKNRPEHYTMITEKCLSHCPRCGSDELWDYTESNRRTH